jgi:hypothetical protein
VDVIIDFSQFAGKTIYLENRLNQLNGMGPINAGQCTDLPGDVVVESMCVVDGEGMRGRDQARVPAPFAELLRRHVATQELTVEAAVTGDRATASKRSRSTHCPGAATCATPRPWSTSCSPGRAAGCRSSAWRPARWAASSSSRPTTGRGA